MNERERIAMLARVLGVAEAGLANGIEVGIGDDAAVLQGTTRRLVWTIDEQVEGTHFRRDLASWRSIGWRSTMAAASDLAAMGAKPWCALAALVLPDDVDDHALEAIAHGQRDAASAIHASVVGGNLSRGPTLSIATTWLGTCERAVTRSGARPGDGVWMAGALGLAAAGLRALETGRGLDARFADAIRAWREPRALIAEGLAMAGIANAAVDVSDGLASDAAHVAEASQAQIVLFEAALAEDPALATVAAWLDATPLDLALHGGEDYAIVATSPSPIPGFRRIGEVRPGEGLRIEGPLGGRALEPRGFDHFAPR